MDETPFNLAFETDAIIPLEVGLTSSRVENFDKQCKLQMIKGKFGSIRESLGMCCCEDGHLPVEGHPLLQCPGPG